jgi:hypothetical protein
MEKKNPGRGLEEISNIFLSTSKKEEKPKLASGFSAVTIREETCASCANMIEGSSKEPKCRIFTFENEKYGVPHLETIVMNYANYCENFETETARHSGDTKKLTVPLPDQPGNNCEIEETVIVQKKIAYPDTETAHKDLRNTLSQYLESGYRIKSVELTKSDEATTPKGKEIKKEDITIFVKKNEPL